MTKIREDWSRDEKIRDVVSMYFVPIYINCVLNIKIIIKFVINANEYINKKCFLMM